MTRAIEWPIAVVVTKCITGESDKRPTKMHYTAKRQQHLLLTIGNKPRIDHSIERLNRDYQPLNNSGHTLQSGTATIHIHRFMQTDSGQRDTLEQKINNRMIS